MVMAFLVTQKQLTINQLKNLCSRCMRFVSPGCNAVYILFTVIISMPAVQYSHLRNVSKYKQITTVKNNPQQN